MVPLGDSTSLKVLALVDLLPAALSLARLAFWQLYSAALASPRLPGIAPAFADNGHGHLDGCGYCPLVGESRRGGFIACTDGSRLFKSVRLRVGRFCCELLCAVACSLPDAPRLLMLASDEEMAGMLQAWSRVAMPQRLEPISPLAFEQLLNEGSALLMVAISPSLRHDPSLSHLIERTDTGSMLSSNTFSN